MAIEKNVPFTAREMQEAFEQNPKDRLMNAYPNRATRREKMFSAGKPNRAIHNNRGNAGYKVYIKMSYFYLMGGRNPLGLNRGI